MDLTKLVVGGSGELLRRELLLRWLLLASVLLLPIYHIGEIMALLDGSIRDQVTMHTWFPLVIVKNMLLPVIVALSLTVDPFERFRGLRVETIGLVILSIITAFAVMTTVDMSIWKFLAGVRWVLPFFLIFLLVPVVDKDFVRVLAYACLIIMVANFVMQLWQLGHMQKWFGGFVGTDLAARPPGFFFIPSTSAMFICFSVLFSLFVVEDTRVKWIVGIVGLMSVFLTLSGTGFCMMLVIVATLVVGKRWRMWFPIIVAGAYEITKIIITYFRGAAYYDVSLGTRGDILSGLSGLSVLSGSLGAQGMSVADIFNWLFGANFGAGTSAAWLLKFNLAIDVHPVSTDSLLAQFIVNFGGVGVLTYLVTMVGATIIVYISGRKLAVLWLVSIGIFSVTTPISEAYPMNVVLCVAIAYLIRTKCFSLDGFWKRDLA